MLINSRAIGGHTTWLINKVTRRFRALKALDASTSRTPSVSASANKERKAYRYAYVVSTNNCPWTCSDSHARFTCTHYNTHALAHYTLTAYLQLLYFLILSLYYRIRTHFYHHIFYSDFHSCSSASWHTLSPSTSVTPDVEPPWPLRSRRLRSPRRSSRTQPHALLDHNSTSLAVADPGGGGGDAPPVPAKKEKKKRKKRVFLDKSSYFRMFCMQVLKLLLVTPVTTASVERAKSALGFVKSDHRSTMSEGRLNALLRLYVHKDIQLDFQEVATAYGHKHPRRMLLGWPLDAWFSSCWTSSSWSSWSSQWLQILCKYCEYMYKLPWKFALWFFWNYTQNSEKCISAHRNFQNFPGEHAPGPPRGGEGKPSPWSLRDHKFWGLRIPRPPWLKSWIRHWLGPEQLARPRLPLVLSNSLDHECTWPRATRSATTSTSLGHEQLARPCHLFSRPRACNSLSHRYEIARPQQQARPQAQSPTLPIYLCRPRATRSVSDSGFSCKLTPTPQRYRKFGRELPATSNSTSARSSLVISGSASITSSPHTWPTCLGQAFRPCCLHCRYRPFEHSFSVFLSSSPRLS